MARALSVVTISGCRYRVLTAEVSDEPPGGSAGGAEQAEGQDWLLRGHF
jgi:hypothetical protein